MQDNEQLIHVGYPTLIPKMSKWLNRRIVRLRGICIDEFVDTEGYHMWISLAPDRISALEEQLYSRCSLFYVDVDSDDDVN
jgi:hypothetical protein